MELTLRQRKRLDELLGESRSQKERRDRKHRALFIAGVSMLILFAFVALWMICDSGWIPGEQEEILHAYKAHRHEATEVAAVHR